MAMFQDDNLRPPLDDTLYRMDDHVSSFFKSQTGIQNDEELKAHVLDVQKQAYKFYGYPCIRRFAFLNLTCSSLPAYKHAVQLRQNNPNAIFLDVGCCFGVDLRKVVADGWPVENCVAADILKGFWDYGHKLFRSNPESFPLTFVEGDVFKADTISPRKPFYNDPDSPRPDLSTLSSLIPLQGHVSAIHASALFHIFSEDKQRELAQQLATLLSPKPGSVIFGSHISKAGSEKGFRNADECLPAKYIMFCHSPNSWKDLWDGDVFEKGNVAVDARLKQVDRPDLRKAGVDAEFFVLEWSVTRL